MNYWPNNQNNYRSISKFGRRGTLGLGTLIATPSPPMDQNVLNFIYLFETNGKMIHWHPLRVGVPPPRRILDLPLLSDEIM